MVVFLAVMTFICGIGGLLVSGQAMDVLLIAQAIYAVGWAICVTIEQK